MGSSGSAPDVTREDIRSIFSHLDEPCTPLTTAEVAAKLECSEKTALHSLEALAELDELQTRQIDDRSQVWWQSRERSRPAGQQSDLEEFGAFVNDVEDYAIFMLDPSGDVVSWNDGAERIKGYTEDEIVGECFSTFYTDADIDEGVPEANLETAVAEGRVEDEGWRVRKDGSRFWADVVITAIRDDDDTLQGFTKVTRDRTEQREYEQQLREQRDLTEQILETVPVSIYTVTPDGEFVRANQRALDRIDSEESGLTDHAVESWDIYDAEGDPIPVDDWPWTQVIETGEPVYDYQCQSNLPDIGRRWLSINAAPIEDGPQAGDRIVVSVDDITEQKERERQLRRESDQTEELLRTAPIAIAVQNAEGDTIMANQRAQEALGLSEQEIIEDPDDADDWEVYDGNGDPLASEETPAARVLATGEPVLDEELVLDPLNGEQMRFRLNATPLFDPDGQLERVITTGEDITELRKREQQLERRKTELETELSDILGRISDAFYALDEDWQFTHINDQAAEIFQQTKDELLGRSIWEVFPKETEGKVRENFHAAMDTQEAVGFELYVEEIDTWLEFNVHPSETGLSIYFHDVTERKTNEQELAKYETIIETINDAIYVLDDDMQFTMVNEAYTELTGYTRDELLGEHASLVVDETTIEQGAELREELADGEATNPTLESTIETTNGHSVAVEGSFTALPSREEEHKRIGVLRDITERKENRRKLEESERRYRRLVEHFPNGAVGLFDEDLRYTAAGGELMDAMDVAPEDRVGTSIYDIYPDELIEEVEPYFHAALEGDANSFEVEHLGLHLLAYTLPIRNADDEIYACMLVVQDITELKETQRRLEESNERLESFASMLAHELRNPLQIAQLYVHQLSEGDERAFNEVDDALTRIKETIDILLVLARGSDEVSTAETVSLADRAEKAWTTTATDGAELVVETTQFVRGQPNYLHHLFENLFRNAIEHGGTTVTIRVGDLDEGFYMADDGRGIPADEREAVFEAGYSSDTNGTGLGLTFVAQLADAFGWEYTVTESAEGGARFEFTNVDIVNKE